MKNRGFTLIEILAVIVVLAIILAISMPVITGVFGNATKNAFESDAKLVIRGIEYQKLEDEAFDVTTINETNVESILKISDENYQSIVVSEVNGKASIVIVGKNKWDGLVAHGTFKTMSVDNIEDYSPDETPPVITILGDSPVTIMLGNEYVDAGATALDDIDGDLTNNIVVTNNLNVNTEGLYSVIYTVMDSAGNVAAPVARIISVIDNAPVITLSGDNPYVIELGSVYSDPGATALDDVDGDLTNDIVVTSNVNPNLEGDYIVTYDVSDSEGKAATTVTRTVYVVDFVHSYSYTGDPQPYVVPIDGIYKIELWGGGTQIASYYTDTGATPGKGAYTKGTINLEEGQILYVYVGAEGIYGGGAVYNGGGAGGGAGATDIRLISGDWNSGSGLRSRIMVAGGGGRVGGVGVVANNNHVYPPYGGHGGLSGTGGGSFYLTPDLHVSSNEYWYAGSGGTQTTGGSGGVYTYVTYNDGDLSYYYGPSGASGTFGVGGSGTNGGGGGGSGYYGGGGGVGSAGTGYVYYWSGGGGGGSSFISGHTGCNAVDSLGNHTGQPNHYSGYVFTNTEIQSGVRTGNGFATITYIP